MVIFANHPHWPIHSNNVNNWCCSMLIFANHLHWPIHSDNINNWCYSMLIFANHPHWPIHSDNINNWCYSMLIIANRPHWPIHSDNINNWYYSMLIFANHPQWPIHSYNYLSQSYHNHQNTSVTLCKKTFKILLQLKGWNSIDWWKNFDQKSVRVIGICLLDNLGHLWVKCSPVVQETGVQSQVKSYQRLKKMILDATLLNT